jgi:hypothetical protein
MVIVVTLMALHRDESRRFKRIKLELLKIPGVTDAIVLERKGFNGEKSVDAMLTALKSSTVTPLSARMALAGNLPHHFLPDRVFVVQCDDLAGFTSIAA